MLSFGSNRESFDSIGENLDVVFKEDYNQCHVKNEAQNLAILRHTALNLIRKNKSP